LFIYPRWEVNASSWWQYLFTLAALALGAALWLIRRRWRGPLAAWLFFVGALFPVLGFFNVYPFLFSFGADHFQYLASLGILVAVSAGMVVAAARLPAHFPWLAKLLGALLLATLATLTWRQSRLYADPESLYQATLESNPACWMCYNNLGILMVRAGQLQEGIAHYEKALQIRSDYADAYNNLGNALNRAGLLSEAMTQYERALKYKPDYPYAHYNLGFTLLQTGRVSEAMSHYEQALRLKPDYADAHNGLGGAFLMMGRLSEARKEFEMALSINPDYLPAQQNLSILQAHQ